MMYSWTIFSEAYQTASPAQQQAIDNEVIGGLLTESNLPVNKKRQVMKLLSYFVLKLNDSSTTHRALIEAGVSTAAAQNYLVNLAELIPELSVAPIETDMTLQTSTTESPTVTPENTPSPNPEVAPSPAAASQVITPLRTMSDDIQKVHGYGALLKANAAHEAEPVHSSNQSDALQKKPLTDLPAYTEEKE